MLSRSLTYAGDAKQGGTRLERSGSGSSDPSQPKRTSSGACVNVLWMRTLALPRVELFDGRVLCIPSSISISCRGWCGEISGLLDCQDGRRITRRPSRKGEEGKREGGGESERARPPYPPSHLLSSPSVSSLAQTQPTQPTPNNNDNIAQHVVSTPGTAAVPVSSDLLLNSLGICLVSLLSPAAFWRCSP